MLASNLGFFNFPCHSVCSVGYNSLYYHPLPLKLWVMPEVDQQSQAHLCDVQIIQQLGLVFRCNCVHGLKFYNYLAVANKIRHIPLLQTPSLVIQLQFLPRLKRNATIRKLYFQTFLVDRLQKSAPHGLVNLEAGTLNVVGQFFVKHELSAHGIVIIIKTEDLPTEYTEKHGSEGLSARYLISNFQFSVSFRVFRGQIGF
jgi:hypothetical protein